ncbi:hypothetical protein [Longispora albida]|uniref:hypothetical protein n=1 Tax=Longispora albida TaxID=203523 RepID=UPI00037D7FBE|nr:hypothetical protein [Longispora albida]
MIQVSTLARAFVPPPLTRALRSPRGDPDGLRALAGIYEGTPELSGLGTAISAFAAALELAAGARGPLARYRAVRLAQDELLGRLAEYQGRARVQALTEAGCPPEDARLYAGRVNVRQWRAAGALRTGEMLAAASGPVERSYLIKALACDHPIAAVEAFADLVRGKPESWLDRHLRLVNPLVTGPVRFEDVPVQQCDGTTCGSMVVLLTRTINDPVYALRLTGEVGFATRLALEQRRIHRATNSLWPQALGTTPWGLSKALGYACRWKIVDDTDPLSVSSALLACLRALYAGEVVPVLIGDAYPRHYVLLIGHDRPDLIFYNPSGEVLRVPESDFLGGRLGMLGFRHAQAIVLPRWV